MNPISIGSLQLASPFILAPLESVSDCAFRRLCWQQGAALTFTEMVRARGLVRNNKATIDLIDSFDADVPTGVQLLVANEKELSEALSTIEKLADSTHPHFRNLSAVDLNFGCPSPEVIKVGAGPALLKRKGKLRVIFETLAKWKSTTRLPIKAVTAKIRLGLNRMEQDQKVYLPIAELANDTLDGLIVHARHARQGSTDAPTWSAIAEIKERLKIPLIGNGNVFTRSDAERMQRETGVDAFLIARGAIKTPWVFRELRSAGALQPTADELEAARTAYVTRATELGSKEKYLTWHAEGFARIANRIAGRPEKSELPSNENL